jgi:hypothetical protein
VCLSRVRNSSLILCKTLLSVRTAQYFDSTSTEERRGERGGRVRGGGVRGEGAGQGVQTDHLLPLYRPIRNGLKISLHLFFPFFFLYLSGIWRKIKDTKKGMRECCSEQKGGGQKGGRGSWGRLRAFSVRKKFIGGFEKTVYRMSIFTRVSNCWPIEKHFQSTAEKIPSGGGTL